MLFGQPTDCICPDFLPFDNLIVNKLLSLNMASVKKAKTFVFGTFLNLKSPQFLCRGPATRSFNTPLVISVRILNGIIADVQIQDVFFRSAKLMFRSLSVDGILIN